MQPFDSTLSTHHNALMNTALTPNEIELELKELPEWTFEDDRLNRELSFRSSRQAIAFLTRIAFEAEEQNHHPEIYIVYNRMAIAITTHDAGDKVTERDFVLAHKIEQAVGEFDAG